MGSLAQFLSPELPLFLVVLPLMAQHTVFLDLSEFEHSVDRHLDALWIHRLSWQDYTGTRFDSGIYF